jgi:nucleoside-diphosphate-sugar epimerase
MAQVTFTILGGTGFIGSHLATRLRQNGHDVRLTRRDEIAALAGQRLGHVVYAIGLTGDFRERLYDTVDAHVGLLSRLLREVSYDSWLYLSSTRVYGGLPPDAPASEVSPLPIVPSADSVYDLSKLLGEALCLGTKNPSVRVARLSNVYGRDQSRHTFLGAVLEEIRSTGAATIRDSPESSKDYVAIDDVTTVLEQIALSGRHRLYNVASGAPVRAAELGRWLGELGHRVLFSGAPQPRVFPPVDISRMTNEFGFKPRALRDDLPSLLARN